MILISYWLAFLILQNPVVPLKPSEEFKVKLEYKFKARPTTDMSGIDLTETIAERNKRMESSSPLPYLIIHLSFSKLSEQEVRIRCTDSKNKNCLSRKVETDKVYTVDLGFTDDMKDRVTAHEYVFVLLSPEKTETSKIVLRVEEDGTFLVNGERRGKF